MSNSTAPVAEKHPIVLFFHFAFKVRGSQIQCEVSVHIVFLIVCSQTAAVVWFILCGFFISSFVLNFVVTIVLIALDFWTVSETPCNTPCTTTISLGFA
jgi:hypothetical protein